MEGTAVSLTALAAYSIVWREIVRFYRQRSRIIASLATPLVLWLLIGFGLQAAFPVASGDRQGFLHHFFPANLLLTVLFTSIFSNISTIQDRKEGFLQGVLVSPVSKNALVFGKIVGGSLIAWFQGEIFILVGLIVGIPISISGWFGISLALLFAAYMLTGLGFVFAWWFDSVQGFHGVMNLILMPMWLLSGAFFPIENAPVLLKAVMWINPLSWAVRTINFFLSPVSVFEWGSLLPVLAVFAFGILFSVMAVFFVSHRTYKEAA